MNPKTPKQIPKPERPVDVNKTIQDKTTETCSGHECFLKRTGTKCSRCK